MENDERAAKAVGRAFRYHPSVWRGPIRYGSWVVGPVFAVKAQVEAEPVRTKKAAKFIHKRIAEATLLPGVDARISKEKHGRKGLVSQCKNRRLVSDLVGQESSWEVPFVAGTLAKTVGVTSYRLLEEKGLIQGYNEEGDVVFLWLAKVVGDDCE